MQIETFTVGMLSTNCYVVSCSDTNEAIIIDPGLDFLSETKPITDYIKKGQLKIKYVVNTHGHSDHIKGNTFFQEKFNVPVCIHSSDDYFLETLKMVKNSAIHLLEDGSLINF